MTEIEERVARSLEAEYGAKVYLSHVKIEGDTLSCEFKTLNGLVGIARFKFTKDTLDRL